MTVDDLPAAFATLPPAWRDLLDWTQAAVDDVIEAIRRASETRPIAPDDPFRALRLVAPAQARVVVFGQDPYPGAGHADGLAFSAPTSGRPSLRRIFDVPTPEIAEMVGLAESTVRWRLARAMTRLASELE